MITAIAIALELFKNGAQPCTVAQRAKVLRSPPQGPALGSKCARVVVAAACGSGGGGGSGAATGANINAPACCGLLSRGIAHFAFHGVQFVPICTSAAFPLVRMM